METKTQAQKNYGGLDLFRMAAALLVAAIHTSPLASVNSSADFFFTRVLARISVPFFFMVTGHFVLSAVFFQMNSGTSRLKKHLLRLSVLYAASILLYLPLGIYAGHYKNLTPGNALRMLIFDGTFYHLWYFPACILGMSIIYVLSRFLNLRDVTFISALLYILGLFGDSYFGLTEKVPAMSAMYNAMFRLFSYTRNGLFLAPLFLVLGIWAGHSFTSLSDTDFLDNGPAVLKSAAPGKNRPALSLPPSLRDAVFLLLSFCAMTAEAFTLRFFKLQRHDSMYFFLAPTAFFLYRCLLSVPRSSRKALRTASTWIYILHPAFIVVIRGAARLLHLTNLLVNNSLLHYLAVVCLSTAAGLVMAHLSNQLAKKIVLPGNMPLCLSKKTFFGENIAICPGTERAWIELNINALEHNVRFLQSRLPVGCRLMPAVKADAYGHGAVPIAKELSRLGIRDFCVACAAEGIRLRQAGIKGQILILGYTHPSQFPLLHRYRLTQTVVDYPYAEKLWHSGLKLHVHIAVDTGMHRLGIRCESPEQIAAVYQMKNLSTDGIFTHLSACDSPAPECRAFTQKQIQAFYQVTETLRKNGCRCRGFHLLSSYGILNYPEAAEDYVRPGIALYGVSGGEKMPFGDSLQPVLSLKARVASLRTLQPGESAGYGLDYIAAQETRIAVLAIGYADGLPRELSSRGGNVLINGKKAPIIGRICMDQTLIDISGLSRISQGDIAVIIGASGTQEITAAELAGQCSTITNEILSRLGARLNRILFW